MNNKVSDFIPLIIFVSLGLPLLLSYYALSLQPKSVTNSFWSNNGKNKINKYGLYYFYVLSMLLAATAGAYLFYYLTWGNNFKGMTEKKIFGYDYQKEGKYFIYVSLLVLIGFSLLWIPSFYMENKRSGFLTLLPILTLFLVGAGAGLLMASIASEFKPKSASNDDKGALASAVYLFFHTFVLDFIIWTGLI